jgi:hypothetical protein
VFCACELIQLFSVVLCVVSVAHKFVFRLIINETPIKWRQCKEGHVVIETHVFDRIYMFFFFLTVLGSVKRTV